jgi:MFS family permease
MKNLHRQRPTRKIYYIHPRYQGMTALAFAILIALGGTVFGWLVDRDIGETLRDVSLRGHYPMETAFEAVRELLAWRLLALWAGVFLAGAAIFLLLVRATHRGAGRAIEVFQASAGGDLSTPSRTRGLAEFARFGEQVDAARGETLELLREIREEAASLASGNSPPEEFRLRWDGLKRKIREVAP